MSTNDLASESVEWRIDTSQGMARVVGDSSAEILGDLFTMWLTDKGDISDWEQAPKFGSIVVEYSDLSLTTVALWLGIDKSAIAEATPSQSGPPWTFDGLHENQTVLDREIS